MSEVRDLTTKSEKDEPGVTAELKIHGKILAGFIGLLWFVQFVNMLTGGALVGLGVHPRSVAGLVGILFAPFIHVNLAHIMSNTLPLAVLGWFVMLRRKRDLFYVSALSALVGGLGTWLIGAPDSVHVGASVLVFGYLGYLLVRGVLERKVWPILGSLAVFLLYGGALFGVLPGTPGVSWQGHLFGLAGGVLAARLLTKKGSAQREGEKRRPTAAKKKEPAKLRLGASEGGASPRSTSSSPSAEDDDTDAELEELRKKLSS